MDVVVDPTIGIQQAITWYQLLAAILVLPIATEWIKKLSFIKTSWYSAVPLVLGAVANVILAMSQGVDIWTALYYGLGLGAIASGTRNVFVKTILNR